MSIGEMQKLCADLDLEVRKARREASHWRDLAEADPQRLALIVQLAQAATGGDLVELKFPQTIGDKAALAETRSLAERLMRFDMEERLGELLVLQTQKAADLEEKLAQAETRAANAHEMFVEANAVAAFLDRRIAEARTFVETEDRVSDRLRDLLTIDVHPASIQ